MSRCRAHAAHWPPCCSPGPRHAAHVPCRRRADIHCAPHALRPCCYPLRRHGPRSCAPSQARSGQPGRRELRGQRLALAHADEREVQAGAVADGRAAAHGLQDIAAFGLAPRARLRRAGRRVTRAPVAVRVAPPFAGRNMSFLSVHLSRGCLARHAANIACGNVQQQRTQSRSAELHLARQAELRSTRSPPLASMTWRVAVVRACTTTPQYSMSCPLVPCCSLRCTSRSALCIAALCTRQTPG